MKIHGYKTYIVGIGTLMYAIGGAISGMLDLNLAIVSGLAALQMMGLMHETPTPNPGPETTPEKNDTLQ